MKSQRLMRIVLPVILSGVLIAGNLPFFGPGAEAQAAGSRSSSSFSGSRGIGHGTSSPWSPATRQTFDRSGGGMFGGGHSTSSGYSKPALPSKSPVESKSSGGYSKPSLKGQSSTETSTAAQSRTSGGYSKPGSPSTSQKGFSGGSKFDKETINVERKKKSQESLNAYKAENSKFKQPETKIAGANYESNPLAQKGKVYSGFDYGTHYQQRDGWYRSQGYKPPGYVFNTSPSFGMFDTIFLFWMLNNISNRNVAATAYHHSDDPGFQKWRQEAENLAKDNSDLKGKLGEMDKQIKSMEGTPKDPAYLPKGVPPDVALSSSVLASKKPEKPVLKFATGQTGGWYDKFGTLFKQDATGLDVKTIKTTGSLENLKLISSGEADLAIVQSDILALIDKKLPGTNLISEQATLYPEYAQLIANRDGGIKSLKDIDPKRDLVYIGPKGSGTALTWEALCELEPKYKGIPVKNADYFSALAAVEKDPKALMFFVGGLNSDFLKKAEQDAKRSGKLRLAVVDDPSFKGKVDKHNNPIYKLTDISSTIYPSLQKGWIWGSDVKTLAVQAVLVLRTDWAKKYGPGSMDSLSLAILEAKPDIQHMVNATK